METGELNKLMGKKKEIMNDEHTTLRESIFRFLYENNEKGMNIWVRVWKDEILNATERDVQESYDSLERAINVICGEIEFVNSFEIAKKILEISRVNAVEVYSESDVGVVLHKDWP